MPTQKTKPLILSKRFLFVFAASAFLVWTIYALADMRWGTVKLGSEKTITVIGSSSEQQNNQIASFTTTITATNEDKSLAYEEANTRMSDLIDSIKAFGVDAKDLKTTYVNVFQQEEPYLENGVQKYKPTQWRASLSLEIKLRDVTRVQDLTTLLTDKNAGDLYGPNYATDDSMNNDSNNLMMSALANARTKAETIAKSQNTKIKGVLSVVEGYNTSNYPVYGLEKAMGGGGSGFEPGTTEVSKSVTVTYIVE